MEKHILSKSTYIKGEQCLKQLYLHKKRAFLRDRMPAERLAIFSRGTHIGLYAQELFPGGIDAGPKHPTQYRKAVEQTAQLLLDGQDVIYEAGFQADKTLILLDILVRNGDQWDAYEVKSSKSLSETYYKDAALQYHVLANAGINIRTFSLIHINPDYVRGEEIDIHQMFIITDVTEEVGKRAARVAMKIGEEISTLESEHSPKVAIGAHCFVPYDCDFIGHCWKEVKRPAVFDIPSIGNQQQFELYEQFKTINLLQNVFTLEEVQQTQIGVQISRKEHFNLSEKYISAIEQIKNNKSQYYAIKILSFTPAMPLYKDTKPYQQIAFAYAIMPINGDSNDVKLYVANGKENPHFEILDQIKQLNNHEFLAFENRVDLKQIFDLQQIIIDNCYYHPAMTKDYSNKSLSLSLGIKAPWKGIESDIVAAQFYDEILRNHKNSEEKRTAINAYLIRELLLVQKFVKKLSLN